MDKDEAIALASNLIEEANECIRLGSANKAIWRLLDAAGLIASVTPDPVISTGRGYSLKGVRK